MNERSSGWASWSSIGIPYSLRCVCINASSSMCSSSFSSTVILSTQTTKKRSVCSGSIPNKLYYEYWCHIIINYIAITTNNFNQFYMKSQPFWRKFFFLLFFYFLLCAIQRNGEGLYIYIYIWEVFKEICEYSYTLDSKSKEEVKKVIWEDNFCDLTVLFGNAACPLSPCHVNSHCGLSEKNSVLFLTCTHLL